MPMKCGNFYSRVNLTLAGCWGMKIAPRRFDDSNHNLRMLWSAHFIWTCSHSSSVIRLKRGGGVTPKSDCYIQVIGKGTYVVPYSNNPSHNSNYNGCCYAMPISAVCEILFLTHVLTEIVSLVMTLKVMHINVWLFKCLLKCFLLRSSQLFFPVWEKKTFDTDLFESSWHTEEFIDGIDRDKQHGGHGHTPSNYVGPVREDILIILQAWRCQCAGDDHKLWTRVEKE